MEDPSLKVLLTGAGGFLGSWMAGYLQSQGVEVIATGLADGKDGRPPASAGQVEPLDVRDRAQVNRVIEIHHPDVVYHFAGQAFLVPSWEDPAGTMTTNLFGTLNLLEALRRDSPRTRFAFAGSGTEYGDAEIIPTPETSPLKPTSPYASSKAAADLLCYQYFRSFELPVFRYRIFGTTGPGKRGDSVNDFASQIAAVERGGVPGVVRVGNLDKSRDVTDVRDAIRAMVQVVERGEPGEAYNIGSGVPRKVSETLDRLISMARVPVTAEKDTTRLRMVDDPVHLADIGRLHRLGWKPEIPFDRTLAETLDHWRAQS
ncbi:MAG: GDP-mannose 4,6-dehydratase [Thermoplasmata archaeon]|nr:GDP-mannose 4,6-dehydratase [Thermoplasmata archaeon]